MSALRYSEKLKDALNDLRPAFCEVGLALAALTKKRKELAPAFHKTWLLWQRETHKPFTSFIQALDSTMPADRDEYRSHPSYRAAQYMIEQATDKDARKRKGLTPLMMVAVTIKSFLPLVGNQKEQKAALEMILASSRWRESDQARLLSAIRRAHAVGLPGAPRLVAMKSVKAVVMAFDRDRAALAS